MGKCILFENARFHTGRRETEVFSYMLVEKGRIKALSNERPAPQEYCRRVDLGGGHAYPCLIDGHTHLLYTIVAAAMGFDVCTLQAGQVVPDTLAGVEQRLRAFAAGKKPGEPVVANNYIPSASAERRLPNGAAAGQRWSLPLTVMPAPFPPPCWREWALTRKAMMAY